MDNYDRKDVVKGYATVPMIGGTNASEDKLLTSKSLMLLMMIKILGDGSMLEIITDIDLALKAGAYRAALALALTIPDICGQVSTPSDSVGSRYKKWFDSWVKQYYPFGVITGDTCYRLRCAYLHAGNSGADESYIKTINFYVHSDGNSFHDDMYEFELSKNHEARLELIRIQINIAKLCAAICAGARDYYNSVSEKSVFDAYSISILSDPSDDFPFFESDNISVQIN